MANPYGIEQVDVPGILSAFTTARAQRTQQLLTERAMAREDAQLERETKLRTAYAKLKIPGADGASGMSTAVSAYGAKDAAPAAPVVPADFGQTPGATGPAAVAAPPVGPVAAPSATGAPPAPGSAPDGAPHPLQGWLDTNSGAIQDIMQQDPQSGLQIMQHFHQLDAEKQQAIVQHLQFADSVNEHGLRLLGGVKDQASWDAARQNYNAFLQQYNLPPQNLPAQYDPATVQGLMTHALSVKEQIDQMKPVVLGKDSQLINPVTHEVIADNSSADLKQFSVHNADGTDTPYSFDPKTGLTRQLREGGATGGGGGTVSGVGTSPKAAAVASALTSAGMSPAVVAGFMGNFHVEGGYDGAKGDGGSATGIGQWHSDRASNFKQVIGKDVTAATPAEQAQFVAWEMQHPAAAGMTVAQRDQILAAKTPAQAAMLIDKYYERSSGKDRQTRMAAATSFAGAGATAGPASGGAGTPITGKAGATLTDEAAKLAAAIYKVKGTLPAGIARTRLDVDKIMNVAANMSMEDAHRFADTTVGTWQNTNTAGQTLTAFSKGPEAKQTRSLSVALEHLELYRRATTALQNGNVPVFNAMSQAIAKATGHPAPTNAEALHALVMDEVVKGVVGAGMALGDRESAAQILKQNSSPAQFAGGYEQVAGLLMGQLHGLNQQYKSGTGRDDFERFLTPMAARFFKAYRDQHGGGGSAPQVGETRRGYRFKGGDPASPSSWEKM